MTQKEARMNLLHILSLDLKELKRKALPIVINIPSVVDTMANRWELVEPHFKEELQFVQERDLISKKWKLALIKQDSKSWSEFEADVIRALKNDSIPAKQHNGEHSPFQALLTLYCYSPRMRKTALKFVFSRTNEIVYIIHQCDTAHCFIITKETH